MEDLYFLFASLIVLVFSVIAHEVAHGVVANALGDPTARLAGRLTLNPIPHIDPIGSVLVPGVLLALNALTGGGFVIGWAKPVPYNPNNLRNPRMGSALIGAAGPLTNFAIALVAGFAVRLMLAGAIPATEGAIIILTLFAYINLLLGLFNLLPIPPLDGSKVLFAFVRLSYRTQAMLESNGLILVLLFVLLFGSVIFPLVAGLFSLIVGVPLGATL